MASDRLERMLEEQRDLQVGSFGADPRDLMAEDRVQFIKDMILALTDELHELLGEIGWKPWASSRHVNRDAAVGELIDAWHFFMNLMLVLGVTPSELFDRYFEKRAVNARRQRNGYDGVSTKCPQCKRALDDPSVDCTPLGCNRWP